MFCRPTHRQHFTRRVSFVVFLSRARHVIKRGKKAYNMEHMETDLRARLEIAPRFDNQEWRDDQLPREWVPDKSPSMKKHMARVRERLKR
jgi:hypothetical protein